MQDVEHAVGEDQRPRQRGDAGVELVRLGDLVEKVHGRSLAAAPTRGTGFTFAHVHAVPASI
jgi:hypothetical protein